MATCQAVNAVLPLPVHKRILLLRCPYLQNENKVQINPEPPLQISQLYTEGNSGVLPLKKMQYSRQCTCPIITKQCMVGKGKNQTDVLPVNLQYCNTAFDENCRPYI
jgi:hypothetical protein